MGAVQDAPFVLRDPPPSVVTHQFGEYGIEYWVRFYTDRFGRRDVIDGGARDRIWYALRRAGIDIPYPHRTIELHEITEGSQAREAQSLVDAREKALRGVDLFGVLSSAERRQLAEMTRQRMFAPGEVIVRQGDTSSELFVIERGEVVVSVSRGVENETEVAHLGKGKFFGEMALLTGDTRRATVRAATTCELIEVGREALQKVLETSPDVAERMSAVVTARQAALGLHAAQRDETAGGESPERKEQLLDRIRRFFVL